jgi:hypothetical protein
VAIASPIIQDLLIPGHSHRLESGSESRRTAIARCAHTEQSGRTRKRIEPNAGSDHDQVDTKRVYDFWNFCFRIADAK